MDTKIQYSQGLNDLAGKAHSTLICLEVNPPRGVDFESVFQRLEGKTAGIDFFNVTDSALARMKCAALPFAGALKRRFGIEPLVNVSCRDRNLIALQGDLLAAWALGVRAVVALTGDAVTVGDFPDGKGVFEVNSVGLLHAIQKLNAGRDLANVALKGVPQYVSGAVVNPNARNIGAEIRRLSKKKEAGACFALSQPVFEVHAARTFLEAAQEASIPILLGLLPLKTKAAMKSVENVPGIKMPENFRQLADSRDEEDLSDFFVNHCLDVAAQVRSLVAGFHVVSGTTPLLALRLAQALVKQFKNDSKP